MAIYKLEVEKKFGQFQFRLYLRDEAPGAFGAAAPDMNGLLDNLSKALEPLDTKSNVDSVVFRNIEYAKKVPLKETVRFSKY